MAGGHQSVPLLGPGSVGLVVVLERDTTKILGDSKVHGERSHDEVPDPGQRSILVDDLHDDVADTQALARAVWIGGRRRRVESLQDGVFRPQDDDVHRGDRRGLLLLAVSQQFICELLVELSIRADVEVDNLEVVFQIAMPLVKVPSRVVVELDPLFQDCLVLSEQGLLRGPDFHLRVFRHFRPLMEVEF